MRIGGVKEQHEAEMSEGQLAISRRNAEINAMNAQTARMNATQPDAINFIIPDETGQPKWVGVRTNDPNANAQIDDILKKGGYRVGASANAANAGDLDLGTAAYRDLVKMQTAALNTVDLGERMLEQLEDQDVMTSFAGGVVSWATSLAGNVEQIAKAAGGTAYEAGTGAEIPYSDLLKQSRYTFDSFGTQASKSAAFRTNIMNFAFASLLSNNPGDKVSDRDMQMKLDSLAANSGDKNAIKATVNETLSGVKRGFNNYRSTFEAMAPGKPLPNIPDRLKLDQKPKTQQAAQPQSADAEAILPLAVKMARGEEVTQEEFNALDDKQKVLLKKKASELGLLPGAAK
jgi:hypothetical protein